MLYIFDKDDNFLNIITKDTGLIETWFKDYQNHLIDEPFVFHVDSESELLPLLKEENQVAFKHEIYMLQQDIETFKLMRIKEIDELYDTDGYIVKVTCEPSWLELYDHFVEDRRIDKGTAQTALDRALNGSRWVGFVPNDLGYSSTNFYWIDAVEALFKIADEWGGILQDYIYLDDNNEILLRLIYLIPRLGRDNGLLIQPGYNAETIERRTLSYPVTAMWGQGASLEIEDEQGQHTGGYTRYITFEDVEWKKSKGDPVDKPLGQKWVGDPQALAKYGYLKEDGSRMHRFGHFSNQDYETPEELLLATWQALQEEKEPEVYHEAVIDEVDRDVFLGDTGTILDRHYGKPIEVQSQITGIEYDILEPKENVKVVLGNYKDMSRDPLEEEIDEIKNNQKKPVIVGSGNFPNKKPMKPTNVEAVGGWETILVTWDYTDEIYVSHYEVYASQNKEFVPDSQFLVYNGKVSSFGHEVKTDEVWYYRVCAVNYQGVKSEYSNEASASTVRIPLDATNFESIVNDAKDKADEAYANANIATQNAMDAIDQAQEGFDAAQQAITSANSADGKAQQAIMKAEEGFNKAQEALTSVVSVDNKAEQAMNKAQDGFDKAQENADVIDVLGVRIGDAEDNFTTISGTVQGLQTTVQNKVDASTYSSKMTQLDSLINTKVSQADADNRYTMQTTFNQFADGFEQRVEAIEDWEIGTRNYALNSDDVVEYVSRARYKYNLSKAILEHPKTQFTISFDMKYTGADEISRVEIYLYDGTFLSYSGGSDSGNRENTAIGGLKNNGDWARYSGTVYSVDDIDEHDNPTVVARLRLSEGGFSANAEIKNMQVEKGNKATDWNKAPEDIDKQFSVINQTITSITQQVQDNEGNIGTLQITATSLAGRLTDAEGNLTTISATVRGLQTSVSSKVDQTTYNSKMTQLDSAIDARITTATADGKYATKSALTLTENSLTTEINKKVNTTTYTTKMQQLDNSIAGKISMTDAEGVFVKGTTFSATIDGLQTTVSNKADKSTVTQLAGVVDTKISTTDANNKFATQSQLTQTASSLTSTITSVRNDLDGLEIGGANLNRDSNNFSPDVMDTYDGSNLSLYEDNFTVEEWGATDAHRIRFSAGNQTSILKGYKSISGDTNTVEGETYTVSFYIKNLRDLSMSVRVNGIKGLPIVNVEPNEAKRVIVTGERISNHLQLQFRSYHQNYYTEFAVWRAQVEKGNKATDWTPAPEDMATQSQISQLSDAINLRVKKGDVMSQINVEANRVLIDTTGKLVLNAQSTLISNAVIKNAHIDTLSGQKIISKSIIADKLDVNTLSAITANLGTVTAGRMLSQNNNMDLNLNTGNLFMQRANFTLGGGARIDFTSTGNRIQYRDTKDGIVRSAGFGVGKATTGYPFAYSGTTGAADLDTLSEYYSGAIWQTTRAISDGASNSINGNRLALRNSAVGWDKGMYMDWTGGTPSINTYSPSNYDYELGTFRRFYGKQSLSFTNYYNERSGWLMETTYAGDGSDITFRGAYGTEYNYQIGGNSTSNAIRNIYLRNQPIIPSDQRLKEDVSDNTLGLDFVNRIKTTVYRLKQKKSEKNQNSRQFGIIAQQLVSVFNDFNIDLHEYNVIGTDEDGYYTVQESQLLFPTMKAVQELDEKVNLTLEELVLKIAELEERINKRY